MLASERGARTKQASGQINRTFVRSFYDRAVGKFVHAVKLIMYDRVMGDVLCVCDVCVCSKHRIRVEIASTNSI